MTFAPDPDWLNEVHAARAYGEVGSGVCDCGLPSMHHDWGMMCVTGNDFDPPVSADDSPPCGSCGEPSIHVITLRGEPMPVCLRHLNHWRTPPDDTPPDRHSEECVQHRTRGFATCICTPPDSRSEVETLAAILRNTTAYARPGRGIVDRAEAQAEAVLASEWLAKDRAQVAAKALREEADEIAIGPDYKDRRSNQAKRLRDRADRTEGGDR